MGNTHSGKSGNRRKIPEIRVFSSMMCIRQLENTSIKYSMNISLLIL
jgi:hypothetical protein